MKFIKRLYYKIFKRYRYLRVCHVSDNLAKEMIYSTLHLPEGDRWEKLPEKSIAPGWCYVGLKERITE